MCTAKGKQREMDMEGSRPSPSPGGVSCSICLEPVEIKGERSVARLKCGHLFHLDCIGSAFNAKGAMQCPNCRQVEGGQWLYSGGCFLQSQLVRNSLSDPDDYSGIQHNVIDGRFGQTFRQGSHRQLPLLYGENNYSTNPYMETHDRQQHRMPRLISGEQGMLVNPEPITSRELRPWIAASNETARPQASSDMDSLYAAQPVMSRVQFQNVVPDDSRLLEGSTYRTISGDPFPFHRHSMNRGIGNTGIALNRPQMHFVPELHLQDPLVQQQSRGHRFQDTRYLLPENAHGVGRLRAPRVSEQDYNYDLLDRISGQDYSYDLSDHRFGAGYAGYAPPTTSRYGSHGNYDYRIGTGTPWV